jgi:hypothetical protein
MQRSDGKFMTKDDIHKFFAGLPRKRGSKVKSSFKKWYEKDDVHNKRYAHHQSIGGGSYNCDSITDEWFRWFLNNPVSTNPFTSPSSSASNSRPASFGTRDLHLFDKNRAKIYFTTASPFQQPDIRTVTITEKASLLVPVYNMSASATDFPSVGDDKNALLRIIKHDLSHLKGESIQATFDDEEIYGCCVVRKDPLPIKIHKENVIGIPETRLNKENPSIAILHGGFWLLIKEDRLTPGDHLLSFKAKSPNYEVEAKILINALI